MRRLRKLEKRVAQLEQQLASVGKLRVVSDAPVTQLLAAESNTAVPIKSGPTSGELDLTSGVIRLR